MKITRDARSSFTVGKKESNYQLRTIVLNVMDITGKIGLTKGHDMMIGGIDRLFEIGGMMIVLELQYVTGLVAKLMFMTDWGVNRL